MANHSQGGAPLRDAGNSDVVDSRVSPVSPVKPRRSCSLAAYAIRDEMPWQVTKWTDFFFQGVMALPYHIYVVSSKIPQNEYTERVAYGTAFVFLLIVMVIALASIILRETTTGERLHGKLMDLPASSSPEQISTSCPLEPAAKRDAEAG